MKKLFRVVVVVMFSFISISVFCAEIDGTWIGVKDGPDGKEMEVRYLFKAEGSTLTGFFATDLGGNKFSPGKIDEKSFEFKILGISLYPTININGTLSGDEIHLTESDGIITNKYTLKRVKVKKDDK